MNDNVVKIDYKDKEIYLIKTAHVSKNSVEDVRSAVDEINPDSICIELDQQRYNKLKNPDQWRETDIVKIIKDNQVGYLLVNLILASYQRKMADKMGSTSGGEMMEGIKLSEERNIHLVLADRSIKATFNRIWNKLEGKEKIKLIAGIIDSLFDKEEISEEELQKLKQADELEAALLEISKEFPNVKKVLVDERDQYLATKIKRAPGKKIVAIIGAAHAKGIESNINNNINLKELEDISKKKSYWPWAIPIAIIGLIVYTFISNKDIGLQAIKGWIIWNGSLSAFGTLLAGGHPLSILTAFIMAPITSLNPLLASGWFAGLVEASIRKPKVKDFEDLAQDTSTIKGFWKNRVTRVLLVVLFANIFSSIGTFISSIDVVKAFIETL